MGFLQTLAAPFNLIIDSVGEAIDKNVTSDEERLTLKNELTKIKLASDFELKKLEAQYETELSNRHKMDMQSDDLWSKRIRPASLAFLLGVVTLLAFTDGNIAFGEYSFVVKEVYIELYKALLLTSFSFYFGGRSIEKIIKLKSK